MKLTKVRIKEFQSIQDSNEFKIGDVTCLVGKNEAGKTALLKALYRLNPIIETDGNFDADDDYPSRNVSDYLEDVEAERREPADVVQATYALETSDIDAVRDLFGPECLKNETSSITLYKGYSNEQMFGGLNVDAEAAIKHIMEAADLPQPLISELLGKNTVEERIEILANNEQTEDIEELTSTLRRISESDVSSVVYDDVIYDRIPKFVYFDEYYQMRGQDNLDALNSRVKSNTIEERDRPLLGLIELAGLDLDRLTDPRRTKRLFANLEAAENHLTQKVLTCWSQNRHLRMKFDIRPAQPEDPPGMTSGTNIWGLLFDTKHRVSIPLGSRSRGFIWFLSFLAWYSQLRSKGENIILLLDEPGLSLHAKAQEDLLRYFERELTPHHQLIYTTHSPFMVDPARFDRVRIVQDLSQDSDDVPEEQEGTKVITEVLDAAQDSLFPLQGALGYEIYQTLFVGPNSLVVEGVSDLLYIQTISALLQSKGQVGLSPEWTITPVGGADKVPTFVAMIGARTNLNVAVLIDYQKRDQQKIKNLYKKKLLHKNHVLTYADFVSGIEADLEDMFSPEFYLKLVNRAYGSAVELAHLREEHPRMLHRLEQYFHKTPLSEKVSFDHYRPARYFTENIASLADELSKQELNRFQQVFDKLNALLPSQ